MKNPHPRRAANLSPGIYRATAGVLEVRQTVEFVEWFAGCRRVNPGDVKPVGGGVSELRIDYGPGYRVYFTQQGQAVIVLLAGGDKRTQASDIACAIDLARNL